MHRQRVAPVPWYKVRSNPRLGVTEHPATYAPIVLMAISMEWSGYNNTNHSVKSRPKACGSSSGSGSILPSTSPDAMLSSDRALPVDENLGRTYARGNGIPSPEGPLLDRRGVVGEGLSRCRASGSNVLRPMVDVPELGALGARTVSDPVVLLSCCVRLLPSPRKLSRNVLFISRSRSSMAEAVVGTGSCRDVINDPLGESRERLTAVMPVASSPRCGSREAPSGLRVSMSCTNADNSSPSKCLPTNDACCC